MPDVQLLSGDCLDLLPAWPADSVAATVTSPPYNLGASPSARRHPRARRGTGLDWRGYGADADALPEPVYQAQQRALLTALYRVTRPGGMLFYVHKDRLGGGRLISPWAWLAASPWHVRQQIVWDQGRTHRWDGWHLAPRHEYIFWCVKGPAIANLGPAKAYSSIWRIPAARTPDHPAPFPAALVRRCLEMSTRPGDVVCDPYAGSGTTGAVALELGCTAILIERDPAYSAGLAARFTTGQESAA